MPTEITVALISVVGIIAGAIGGALSNRYIERNKASIQERSQQNTAQREYEYEARKRLYSDLQPLLFQLSEACDSAMRRFRNLVKASRLGGLGNGSANWLSDPKDEYYLLSTMYRFMLPVVLVRLCRRRLTFLDLRLDDRLRRQYQLAGLIYQTWNDGHDIAKVEPALSYRPAWHALKADDPAGPVTAVQHLVIGELDLIAESMTVKTADGRERAMDFGEFTEAYANTKSTFHVRLSVLADSFRAFRQDRRPVMWRLLICQASIWQAFIRAANQPTADVSVARFTDAEIAKLDWRRKNHEGGEPPDVAARAGNEYAVGEFEKTLAKLG